ncbi:MAG TPA: hypothetical protein VE980_17025 [Pyrinomonadaceae bacterium]|nr:hypothetical protein [Pyrinomonadaceae bacterium]
MKKAIALKGVARIGKSQTIRTVDELLRVKYPDAIVEHEYRTKVELRVVLSINGVKIGIETTGENIKRINESFDLFVNLGCEVIICATRTSGKTVMAVNALPGYDVVWLEQQAQSNPIERVLGNLAMARQIVEETEKSIAAAKPAVFSHAAGR